MSVTATMVRGVESSHREESLDWIVVINRGVCLEKGSTYRVLVIDGLSFSRRDRICVSVFDYSFCK
jgi:hypothetical protein